MPDTVVESLTISDSSSGLVVVSLSHCSLMPNQISCVLSAFVFCWLLLIKASACSVRGMKHRTMCDADVARELMYT